MIPLRSEETGNVPSFMGDEDCPWIANPQHQFGLGLSEKKKKFLDFLLVPASVFGFMASPSLYMFFVICFVCLFGDRVSLAVGILELII